MLVALLLSACSFTTDTVATVGPEKITRGELVAIAGTQPASQAQALNTLIYGRLIALEARARGVTADERQINARTASDIVAAKGTDGFVAALNQNYPTAAAYEQGSRQQLLLEGLRPYWSKPTVQAATLQALYVDTQARAQEVTQKGRAGASFDDLLKQYAPAAAQSADIVNSQGSVGIDGLEDQLRPLFGTIQVGAWSEPLPQNGQYVVLRIAAIETRAPTANDENGLIAAWLNGLKAQYPVTITDPAIRAVPVQ